MRSPISSTFRSSALRSSALCALVLTLVACADPKPSRVIAIVDAESLVRESTREVVVSVWGGESNPPGEDALPLEEFFVMRRSDAAEADPGFDWPLRILLRPRDGRDRTYRIRVRAYDSAVGSGSRPLESFVAETRAVNRYARGEVRELRLLLIDECIGQMCEENQRCVARDRCEALAEDPLEPPMDAGTPTDDAAMPECVRNVDCDDDDVCTDDACVEGSCVLTNNSATCSDGDVCTSDDTCSAGACVGGVDPCAASGLTCEEGRCVGCTDTCPDSFGEWSDCTFGDECTTNGTQGRSVTPSTCMAGTCVPVGDSETVIRDCMRGSTDRATCGDAVPTPGPCNAIDIGCGTRSGERTVTIAQPTCSGGVCGSTTDSYQEGCTVSVPCTDGGLDAGPRDAGRDAGDAGDAGAPCVCMTGTCSGRPCANGGTCNGSQCVGGETSCSNGLDDDLDTLVDCDDPDCSCGDAGVPEMCDNGFDDDGDSLVDCADAECTGQMCSGCGSETCTCLGTTCEDMEISDSGVMMAR